MEIHMSETFLQVRSNGQITLPSTVRRAANLKEGDLLEVMVDEDGTVRLVPQIAIERSQAYFWTRRWQNGERETDDDLLEGRFQDFANMDDLIAGLNGEKS
jgi:AbrB family looped-hinge helix DNA binding protein